MREYHGSRSPISTKNGIDSVHFSNSTIESVCDKKISFDIPGNSIRMSQTSLCCQSSIAGKGSRTVPRTSNSG